MMNLREWCYDERHSEGEQAVDRLYDEISEYAIDKERVREIIDDLKKLQKESGSHDDYGQGLHNGLELARISLVLVNESEFIGLDEWEGLKNGY